MMMNCGNLSQSDESVVGSGAIDIAGLIDMNLNATTLIQQEPEEEEVGSGNESACNISLCSLFYLQLKNIYS